MTFDLRTSPCASCRKPMMKKAPYGLFPLSIDHDQAAQTARAGVVIESMSTIDDKKICVECEKAGKAFSTCALCKTPKPSSRIEESFGEPAEYLCSDCYETVPAKVWDEKAQELRDRHRYDFE